MTRYHPLLVALHWLMGFGTKELPAEHTVTAPDGSHVRELLVLPSGSAAHFELAPGAVSRAGRHRTVDEIWYILEGRGHVRIANARTFGMDQSVGARSNRVGRR